MTLADQPTLVKLPVWEPAGRDIELSESDLLQHLIFLGATGSGKSSLLHRVTEQLIGHEAGNPTRKPGLLIFDAKVDDTVERVRAMAVAAGREKDLVVLPGKDHYIDLLGSSLRTLADVEFTVRRLLLGSGTMGRDNAYWDETRYALIDAALTLLLMGPDPVNFKNGLGLMREWFFGSEAQSRRVKSAVETMVRRLEELDGAEEQKVMQTLDTLSLWQGLDQRTRSNVQSTLMLALRPLTTVPASQCFESHGREAFDVGEIATNGRIAIVSLSALNEPGLASLFFRIIKADFFHAVHRGGDRPGRLKGIIADELPLLATADDPEALATIRSRRCFVAAASQGLGPLDEKLGVRVRKSMVANFGSVVFLRGREEETDLFAAVHLGVVETAVSLPIMPPPEEGSLGVLPQPHIKLRHSTLVCPPGTLGRLAPHQGFATLPNHYRHQIPLCFVPWFESAPKPSPPAL